MEWTLALSPQGQQRLAQLRAATERLEAAWREGSPDDSERMRLLSKMSSEVDEFSRFEHGELAPGLAQSLILEGQPGPWKISCHRDDGSESLRLQGALGLDVRIHREGGKLYVQGRRRPHFSLYEYLTTVLDENGGEESRIESYEGTVVRSRA